MSEPKPTPAPAPAGQQRNLAAEAYAANTRISAAVLELVGSVELLTAEIQHRDKRIAELEAVLAKQAEIAKKAK